MSYTTIDRCRVCGGHCEQVISLGEMALSGVFPKPGEVVESGPLTLVRCRGECGLAQLAETYDLAQMYGDGYGYRSALNKSMVANLAESHRYVAGHVTLKKDDVIIDIGSNDGTFLKMWPAKCRRIGVDPSAARWVDQYKGCELEVGFFPQLRPDVKQAKVVTSIACFYDLPVPVEFAQAVANVLAPDGVWYLEQVYLPTILADTIYDTVCHEHLEYYSLSTIKYIVEKVGLRIVDVTFNEANGGSFGVLVTHADNHQWRNHGMVSAVLRDEFNGGLHTPLPYQEWAQRVKAHPDIVHDCLDGLREKGAVVHGWGASTKGNILLQWCELGPHDLPVIVDVNRDKWGCVTPGTNIPIVSDADGATHHLVLPWHFRKSIKQPGKYIFPLPQCEVVDV